MPGQPVAGANERNLLRNLPRKERHKLVIGMMQPLLRPYGDYRSYKLPYKYLSKVTGVPARLLARERPGKQPAEKTRKPNLDPGVLAAMPEFQQEYLNVHSYLSLQHRAALLSQAYPESPPWTTYYLRTAYSRLGIKFKAVRINRNGRRPDQVALIAKDAEKLRLMQEHLLYGPAPDQLILIDECIFSVKTFNPLAWSASRRNVAQVRRLGAQKCVAVVAAVSADGGLILFERRPSSFNGYHFS
jgi:hypothetical protein